MRIKHKLNQQSRPFTMRVWHVLLAGFLILMVFYLGAVYGYFVIPRLESVEQSRKLTPAEQSQSLDSKEKTRKR
jgi:hypothetical protein